MTDGGGPMGEAAAAVGGGGDGAVVRSCGSLLLVQTCCRGAWWWSLGRGSSSVEASHHAFSSWVVCPHTTAAASRTARAGDDAAVADNGTRRRHHDRTVVHAARRTLPQLLTCTGGPILFEELTGRQYLLCQRAVALPIAMSPQQRCEPYFRRVQARLDEPFSKPGRRRSARAERMRKAYQILIQWPLRCYRLITSEPGCALATKHACSMSLRGMRMRLRREIQNATREWGASALRSALRRPAPVEERRDLLFVLEPALDDVPPEGLEVLERGGKQHKKQRQVNSSSRQQQVAAAAAMEERSLSTGKHRTQDLRAGQLFSPSRRRRRRVSRRVSALRAERSSARAAP